MLLSRLVSRSVPSFMTLLLLGNAMSAEAQQPTEHVSPIQVSPQQIPAQQIPQHQIPPHQISPGQISPQHPPEFIFHPVWQFADIHVTVSGPNSVRIDWIPLNGADQYRVYRNGLQIGPIYPSAPTATQQVTVFDHSAPAYSKLAYYVTAGHKTSTPGLPGSPGAGKVVVVETPLQTSSTVTVTTPLQVQVLNNWAYFNSGVPAGQFAARSAALKGKGFVDLHTHPLSYLGFGGKLIFGAVDPLAPLPPTHTLIGTSCWPPSPIPSEFTAMGSGFENIVYGPFDPLANPCGDDLRAAVISALPLALNSKWYAPLTYLVSGYPAFQTWPEWNDTLRQKMWVEWLRRTYQGGLRVMVALAVNNQLLGDITAGPGDLPTDDLASADKQILEIKNFVARHGDFMQLAFNSTDVYNAVNNDKLAVVVGVEIDHTGNLKGNVPASAILAEIDRLYGEGVRYIFPVHLVDNPIGATAAYSDLFNVANVYENGVPINLTCQQDIGYHYDPPSGALTVAAATKLGTRSPGVPPAVGCQAGFGNVNAGSPTGWVGLTPAGKVAVQHMMDLGMLIDVDHMSELAANDTIELARQNHPVAYPLMSGHNNLRFSGDPSSSERQLTARQYAQLGLLHGMAGIGSAKADSALWLSTYQATLAAMVPANVPAGAFGTDVDGMEFMMPPRPGSSVNPPGQHPPIPPLGPAQDGTRVWDYNHDGVAHYGLLPDYLLDVASLPGGQTVVNRMFDGAQYFYETWYLVEQDKRIPGTPPPPSPPSCESHDTISCDGYCDRHPTNAACKATSDECQNRHLPGCNQKPR